MLKIICSERELLIQYYVAKWCYKGLEKIKYKKCDLFKTNVQNFRWMLCLDTTTNLVQPTKHQFKLAKRMKNKTREQVLDEIVSLS